MKALILSSLFIIFFTACVTRKMEDGALANLKWRQVQRGVHATPWLGVIDPFPKAAGVDLRTGEVKWQGVAPAPPQEPPTLSVNDFLPPPFPELLPVIIHE